MTVNHGTTWLWQTPGMSVTEHESQGSSFARPTEWPPAFQKVTLNDDWIIEVQCAAIRAFRLYDKSCSDEHRRDAVRRKIFGKLGEAAVAIYRGLPATALYATDLNAGDIDGIEVKFCSRHTSPRLIVPERDRSNIERQMRPYVLVVPVDPVKTGEFAHDPFELAVQYRDLYLVGWLLGREVFKFQKEADHRGNDVISVAPRHLKPMNELRRGLTHHHGADR